MHDFVFVKDTDKHCNLGFTDMSRVTFVGIFLAAGYLGILPTKVIGCPNGCNCNGNFVACDSENNNGSYTFDAIPSSLPAGVTFLYVAHQNISRISREDFRNYGSLENIFLDDINLQAIEEGTFADLHNLISLFVRNSSLRSINAGTLRGLQNFKRLSLTDNEWLVIEPCTFSSLPSFEFLNLENNSEVNVTIELFVSDNCINATYPLLERIFITDHAIGLEQHDWLLFPSLNTLTFGRPSEHILNRTGFISTVRDIRSLTLKTDASYFPKTFFNNSNAHLVYITDSSFSELPANAFVNMPKLEQLHILRSRLRYIHPEAFNELPHLWRVELSETDLQTLPSGLFAGLGYVSLFLEDNKLETLPSGLLSEDERVYIFNLAGNPWNCDCSLYWVIAFLRENPATIYSYRKEERDAVCAAPSRLANATFTELINDRGNMTGCEPLTTTPVPTTRQTTTRESWPPIVKSTAGTTTTTLAPVVEGGSYNFWKSNWYYLVILFCTIMISCCKLFLFCLKHCCSDEEVVVVATSEEWKKETAASGSGAGLRDIYTNDYSQRDGEQEVLTAKSSV